MACFHRLEPLLARQAERCGWPIPAVLAETWREARRHAALVRQAAPRVALAALDEAGIATVALKGVALA